MKGLVIKDFYNLRKVLKQYAALGLFFGAMSIIMKSGFYIVMMVSFLTPILSISALTYDEQSNFNKYSLTLPVRVKDIVKSKYVLLSILTIGALLVATPIGMIISSIFNEEFKDLLILAYIVASVALCLNGVMISIIYKVGSEKSRMIMMAILAVPMILVYFLISLLMENTTTQDIIQDLALFVEKNYRFLLFIPIILVVIIMVITYRISVGIMKKKEF